jgi:multiple sugar transport system substrate-binding protein
MSRFFWTRATLILATGLLLVTTIVGASGTDEQPAAAAEAVEIVWLFSENPADINLEKLISTFEAANPNLKIKPLHTPSRYTEKVHTLIASGDPPDLMRLNDDYVQDYAVRGILKPLDDFIKKAKLDTEGFISAFWDWPKVDGKHMSWVKGLTAEVIWTNVDAFEESGVALPSKDRWNWDDFLATAKKMTVTEGSEIKRYGGSVSHTFPSHEVTWSVNNGGNVYSDDGRKFLLAEPKGAEAVQWVADLALKHKVQPAYSMWGQFDRTDLFASGTLAMFNGDSRQIPSLTRKVEGQFRWAARPIPGRVNYKSGGAFDSHVIPAEAKHPEEAFKWLAFLTSEDAYKIMGEVGFWLPANPKWATAYWLPDADLPLDRDIAVRALDSYLPVPKTSNTERARQVYWPQIRLVMNGDITAVQALKDVEAEVNELLAEF